MPGKYTYYAVDLMSNAILGELPCTDTSFDSQLKGTGAFSAKLNLDDPLVQKVGPIALTQPTRTAIFVDRDGVLVWGGILWTRTYGDPEAGTSSLDLAGNEFWSYFARRRIKVTKVYSGADQLYVAQDLINYAQSVPGGNIGVAVGAETSGMPVTLTYNYYERRTVSREIEVIANTTMGFDFAVDVQWAGGVPAKTLRLGYPRRGVPAYRSGLMFEQPGNVLALTWPEDGTLMADSVSGIGAGSATTMLLSEQSNPALLDAGYPLLEDVVTDKTIASQAVLDSYTTATLQAYASPPTPATVTVSATADPPLGSYGVGDEGRFRFTNPRFPGTLEAYLRIIGIKVTPGNEGVEHVVLTLGPTVA